MSSKQDEKKAFVISVPIVPRLTLSQWKLKVVRSVADAMSTRKSTMRPMTRAIMQITHRTNANGIRIQ